MGCLIYPKPQTKAIVEAVDPLSGYEGVGPCLLGTPVRSADGRCAHIHPWSEAEMDWLEARLSGIKGAVVSEKMPDDWKGAEE